MAHADYLRHWTGSRAAVSNGAFTTVTFLIFIQAISIPEDTRCQAGCDIVEKVEGTLLVA